MSDENSPPDHGRLVMKCRILHKAVLTYAGDEKDEYQNLLELYAKKKISATELDKNAKLILRKETNDRRTAGHLEVHRSFIRNLAIAATGRPFIRNPLEDDRDVPSPELLMVRFYLAAWSNHLVGVDKRVAQLLYEAVKYLVKDLIQLSATMKSSSQGGRRLTYEDVVLARKEYPSFFNVQDHCDFWPL